MYWRPSIAQATGWPTMPEPVWNRHSGAPVAASNASNSPVWAPVNTSPPAVESTPAKRGMSLGASQRALPVSGSMARSDPRGPSGQTQAKSAPK